MKYFHFSIFVLILVILAGCKEKQQVDFSKYINGYTSGVIKASSPIILYLAESPDNGYQYGSVLPAGTLQFSPAIKGELTLRDNNSIEFIPAERFKNGIQYKATFDLGAICKVPEQYRKFQFQFDIVPLSVVYEPGELLAEPENEKALRYQGLLQSSDFIPSEEIEKMISATFEGQELQPEWRHEDNKHYFVFKNLIKTKNNQTLTLNFAGNIKNTSQTNITIPGLDDFTVLNVKANDSEPPVISIYMSENIDPDQNLNGLISLQNISDLNYKIADNVIHLYPSRDQGNEQLILNIYPGIRSVSGNTLEEEFTRTVQIATAKPQVKLIGKGVIVPGNNQIVVPFSCVALKAIDLEIVQVLNQNMNFFLQENSYDNSRELTRTARSVFMKKIDLAAGRPDINLNKWNDFTINLSDLIKLEKGTVYRLRLKFKKSYTTLTCADENPDSEYGTTDWDNPNSYYSEYYYPSGYEWDQRNNPCSISYYIGDRFEARNIINTSLGIMAKQGSDNQYYVCVSDLNTTEPVQDCQVYLYNYQNQKVDSARTDRQGIASLKPTGKAFIVFVQKGKDKAWLRLGDGNALSLSNFDVSGQHVQMGVKGFIYGERGIWRPGDELYLSLILEDKLGVLPEGHPIVAQLTDPNGHITQTLKGKVSKTNIHCFTFKTDEDAQTGYWQVLFRVGGLTFKKTLRIETIKPNRLAIQTQFPNEKIIGKGISTAPVEVKTKWLNGAPTSNQKAITEVRLYNANAGFSAFPDYSFSDKSRYFEPATFTLFDGQSNAKGDFSFHLNKIETENAPGILNATFTTRVFENGGDFSISAQSIRYSPYTEYVGIRLPQSDDNWYSTRKTVRLNGVTVTPLGEKTGNATIRIEVYKLGWHWWWDSEDENLSSYVNREYSRSILNQKVKVNNGTFFADLNINEYGRYFIRATDPSGHTSGLIAYFGSWSENSNQEAATMLHLSTDKKSYRVGEKIKITIPSSAGATAIVSLENGKTISNIRRIPTQAGSTTLELDATSEMCPNTYVAVTLLQPHQDRDNDRPIRLYGVVNINIEDPDLHLLPELTVAPELRPGKDFTVEVKEQKGRAMNYTLAIVDEGLLSLTTFKTPDPFTTFYAREALGVKTWDFYDYIFGAYGARLDKAFAVGGDEAIQNLQDEKTNRFKPVVLFAGPFTLKAGATDKHSFRMPEYIGEVRTMLVAATNGQYGSAAISSTVNKPLMISVALPRQFTPGDIIYIPVTVFAMKDNIRDVTVRMKTDDKITLPDGNSQQIHFENKGEQVIYFKARINDQTGVSTLRTEATSSGETATVTEDVVIRIPNPRITRVEEKKAGNGESVSFKTNISGAEATSVLEISSIPPLNLEQRLSDLIAYPHGCAEQITSQAFPQLSLPSLLSLTPDQQMETEENVRKVINRLRSYQTSEGGFAYWPGGGYISEWATNYAVQFLVSAKQQGYTVPLQMLENATNYMKRVANSWNMTEPWSQQEQAYRLYVLALAGKPDMAAMNRLQSTQLKRPVSQWLLASAYALSHQESIADKMVRSLSSDVIPYRETGGTFGSTTRDNALILQSMVILNMQQPAYQMLEKISRAMGSSGWYSTQETAFALHAAAMYVQKFLGSQQGIDIIVTTSQGKENIKTDRTIWQKQLKIEQGTSAVTVQNEGKGTLYIRQINSSAPLEVVKEKITSGLSMNIRYYDDNGNVVNITEIKQGTDITAEISIRNTGITGNYQELALSYLIPSGFEIINDRLTGNNNAWPGAEYVDIRDDRYYVYFSLDQNQTKTFKFRFNAAFRGKYMLPAIQCTAMYDNDIQAVWPGGEIIIH